MLRRFIALARDSRGATAVEYGLVAALIVIAAMTAIQGVASQTVRMWNNVSNESANAMR
jgi:pilus assembly protein Flp/PilA